MLRGFDVNEGPKGDEPTIIKVAGRTSLDADGTVYVNANVSGDDVDRQERVAEEFRRLESAGVIREASVVTWQETDALARYEEFRDAAGEASLAPFFEELAGGNALRSRPSTWPSATATS